MDKEKPSFVKNFDELIYYCKWDAYVINLWDEPSFCAVSLEEYSRYMADPIHPTLEGYKDWWAPYIEKKIFEILEAPQVLN